MSPGSGPVFAGWEAAAEDTFPSAMWREGVLLAADGSRSSIKARGREAEKPLSPGLGTLLQWGSTV